MRDDVGADLHGRLRCVRGHLSAIARMLDRGDDDLKVVHQLRAVQGALTQIQVRLWRAQLDRWADQPLEPGAIEEALIKIVTTQPSLRAFFAKQSPGRTRDCFVARPVRRNAAGARLANSAPRNDG